MALTIIFFSVIRIAWVEQDMQTFTGWMISFYLILFAIVFLMVECDVRKSRQWFYFLNSALGKGLFYVFLFLLCLGGGGVVSWVDRLLASIFFVVAVIFITMYCFFKSSEAAYIDQLVQKIPQDPQSAQNKEA